MEEKYLEAADAALDAVYHTASDIFSDVWGVLQEMDQYDKMRENVAKAIREKLNPT
jgi:hypothetical protein